jgi:peptidoglycan/LPS O-acetylase OafA/YrhL
LRVTKHQQLGSLGVSIFFVVSGFLVTRSAARRNDSRVYWTRRARRILPGLAFVVVACALAVGPIFTILPATGYLSAGDTYLYLINVVPLYGPIYFLPGVFVENPTAIVNGSLWTLPLEAYCYVAVWLLSFGRAYGRWLRLGTTLALGGWAFGSGWQLGGEHLLDFGRGTGLLFGFAPRQPTLEMFFCFGLGAVLSDWWARVPQRLWLALLALAAMLVLSRASIPSRVVFYVPFAYLLLWLAHQPSSWFSNWSKYGDFSYGTYLWGFPIGQMTLYAFEEINSWFVHAVYIVVTAALTLGAAYLSWHLVEKRALRFAPLPARDPAQPISPRPDAATPTD